MHLSPTARILAIARISELSLGMHSFPNVSFEAVNATPAQWPPPCEYPPYDISSASP